VAALPTIIRTHKEHGGICATFFPRTHLYQRDLPGITMPRPKLRRPVSDWQAITHTTIDSIRICRNHSRVDDLACSFLEMCSFVSEEWPKEIFEDSQRLMSRCALLKNSKEDDFGIRSKLLILRWIRLDHGGRDKFRCLRGHQITKPIAKFVPV